MSIASKLLKAGKKLMTSDEVKAKLKARPTTQTAAQQKAAKDKRITEYNKPKTPTAKTGSKLQKLQYKYDGLKPSDKRAERALGSDSEFFEVFTARNMTPMKDGGGVSKAMGEDRTRSPKGYDAASQAKKQTKKTVKKKHGGKVVSGNDGNSIVAGCYD